MNSDMCKSILFPFYQHPLPLQNRTKAVMLIRAIVLPVASGPIFPLLQPLGVVSGLAEMRGKRARQLALNPKLRRCSIGGRFREKTSCMPRMKRKADDSL
jgi:hypothetical protein